MTGKTVQHLLYTLLAIVGVIRRSKCDLVDGAAFEQTEREYLNEYIFFDESKYLAKLQEFDDTSFEIDLINRNRKHRLTHEEPRVLYQVGVSSSHDVEFYLRHDRDLVIPRLQKLFPLSLIIHL